MAARKQAPRARRSTSKRATSKPRTIPAARKPHAAKKRPRVTQAAAPTPTARRRSWALRIAAPVAVLVLAFAGVLLWSLLPGPGSGEPQIIHLRSTEPAAAVEQLDEAGLISRPLLLRTYLALSSVELRPGQHLIHDGLSARDLVQRLARVPSRPFARVTLPEGWNLYQVAERLEKLQVCSAKGFLAAATDARLLQKLQVPATSAEGWILPATYNLRFNSHPHRVMKILVTKMKKRLEAMLTPEHRAQLQRRGWGKQELLTLASMVEKEAARANERPVIASVFLNRLDDPSFKPKKLQSDPTSAYGCYAEPERIAACKGFQGRITPALNKDPKNRYSTYVTEGLPPGPIASPGLDAIRSVVEPAKTRYFYFVAQGDGAHVFSETYDQHLAAIKRLRR